MDNNRTHREGQLPAGGLLAAEAGADAAGNDRLILRPHGLRVTVIAVEVRQTAPGGDVLRPAVASIGADTAKEGRP